MAEIVLSLKGREISRVAITKGITTIGRDPECDLCIDNVGVSRVHASLRVLGTGVLLYDHGSANGTFVNGERIAATHVLNDGDRIAFGKFSVTYFAASGPPIPLSSREPQRVKSTLQGMPPAEGLEPDAPAVREPQTTVRMSSEDVQKAVASGELRMPTPRVAPRREAARGNAVVILISASVIAVAIVLAALIVSGRLSFG
jgi:hypothetical protein